LTPCTKQASCDSCRTHYGGASGIFSTWGCILDQRRLIEGFMSSLLQEIQTSLLHLVGLSVEAFPSFLIALVILFLTRYTANAIRRMAAATGKRMTHNQSLRSLLVQTSYVATWVAGILFACVLVFPSLRLGDLVGLLGLSSVAIGFAFQDIFKNFLAGILLLLNESFRLGDQVIVDQYEGTIEDITIRATQIKTYQGERVVIPNAIAHRSRNPRQEKYLLINMTVSSYPEDSSTNPK